MKSKQSAIQLQPKQPTSYQRTNNKINHIFRYPVFIRGHRHSPANSEHEIESDAS